MRLSARGGARVQKVSLSSSQRCRSGGAHRTPGGSGGARSKLVSAPLCTPPCTPSSPPCSERGRGSRVENAFVAALRPGLEGEVDWKSLGLGADVKEREHQEREESKSEKKDVKAPRKANGR